jgi:hypothetical protein
MHNYPKIAYIRKSHLVEKRSPVLHPALEPRVKSRSSYTPGPPPPQRGQACRGMIGSCTPSPRASVSSLGPVIHPVPIILPLRGMGRRGIKSLSPTAAQLSG